MLYCIMEVFREKKINNETYQNMYYINALSQKQDRYLCENSYLSSPKKFNLARRPLS